MRREIKFRGIIVNTSQWVEGFYFNDGFKDFIREYADNEYFDWEVKPETVGELTGLKDKNGKEIYEGDICKAKYAGGNGDIYTNSVKWNSGGWDIANSPLWTWEEIEIIGNIYEHAHILK